MYDTKLIKQSLYFQGLPIYETDIQYIQQTLLTISHAQNALKEFPHLNKKVPITIVDQRLVR